MIHTIDLHFLDVPRAIAAYLIETAEGPLLIETGPFTTFQNLEKGVKQYGYDLSEIKHVLLTHIHFDHAGAAWALAKQGATIYVHPLGAKHMAHPERLYESARRIYQDDMDRLWGQMEPIPENQVVSVEEGQELTFGDTVIQAWHTPGHAVHHIAWQLGEVLFTGDVAGVRIDQGIVEPPCPPPDINVEDWQRSIQRIRQLAPKKLFLTHFGSVKEVDLHLEELEKNLLDWADWIRMKMDHQETSEEIEPEFKLYVANELRANGADDQLVRQYEAANPSGMSVAGLLRYWKKKTQG